VSRIALLGAAHIHTPNFTRTLAARAGAEVRIVWDHDLDRARRAAEPLGAVATDDLAASLEHALDAVVICSETVHHERLVDAACARRLPLFVEKPLGMNALDSARMRDRIAASGVRFQTGFFMRSAPAHRFLRTEIAKGTFGRITHARHSNCHAGALQGWFDAEWRWMADPARAGVGAFGDLGAHSVDLLCWLLGRVRRVNAATRVVTGRYAGCDELGEGLLEFESGALGSVVAGWVDVANPVTLTIAGTEGCAWTARGQLHVHCERLGADGKSAWTDLPPARPHAFDQFLDAIDGGGAELVGVDEALHDSQVIDALYRSAREGRAIEV
jgi:predicted dehydrogenase